MTIPATRVLAFPGIDLEALTELRARACDAFVHDDLAAYQDACVMMRKLIGGRDVSETGARSYRYSDPAAQTARKKRILG
jgi:ABC-type amino acid transport substrate-binding protein